VGRAEAGQESARTILPTPATPAGALIRLASVSLGFFAALGAGLALAGILVERTLPSSTFAGFGGWQLNTLATGLAVILSAVLLLAATKMARSYRRLRGRTPHRRAVVLAAFLPGALLGSFVGNPMSAAVVWASNHTADATHARIEARQLLAEGGKAPPVRSTGQPAPPATVAALMVQRSDLGPSWYSQLRPNPTESTISAPAKRLGATRAVRTTLNQAHWTGAAWLPQHVFLEGLLRFTSAANARHYLRTYLVRAGAAPIRVGAVPVYETGVTNTASWRTADFVVGTDVFTLSINVMSDGTPSTKDFAALVTTSVQRATAGS
jgi:hypothetical protein